MNNIPKQSDSFLSTASKHQLRIIAGQWRGRKLTIANVEGLRPTGDRIRETLFNWLAPEIRDSQCVDLFAGSGALGLECLSRGAAHAWLIEKHPTAIAQLRQHCSTLNIDSNQVVQANSLEWLKQAAIGSHSINIIFIDPPFSANLWQDTINLLNNSNLLAEDAAIYIESPKSQIISTPAHWLLEKEKYAGQVSYRLFRYVRRDT